MRDEFDNYEPSDDWEGDPDGSDPVGPEGAPESTIPRDASPQVNGHLSGPQANGNGYVLTHPNDLQSNLKQWQMQLAGVAYRLLRKDPEYADKALPAQNFLEPLIRDLLDAVEALKGTAGSLPPAYLTESDIHEECEREARLAIEDWLGVQIWSKPTPPKEQHEPESPNGEEALASEDATRATVSNAEYLSRPSIVERLYYTQHISLGVGGKHEGKTTCVRTEALAVATEKAVYGRKTSRTHVLYVASEDEYPTSRMELLRMGWTNDVPLTMVRVKTAAGMPLQPEQILQQLARMAVRLDSHFVILDMLFDFVSIQDEIKYAQTRYAIGFVQRLADAIAGHVRSTHHSPKWMPDAASAAKAALGSQGIAARFSPILLSKKWADDLYTVESTTTRDPRGAALPVLCIERDAKGWADTKGEFKAWMKWKLYRQRILDLFGNEPGKELTVAGVVDALEISRVEAQNALYQMSLEKDGVRPDLGRQKFGKGNKYKYYLNSGDLFSGEKW